MNYLMNFTHIDLATAILVASVGLLVWAVFWRVHLRAQAPTPAPERNGIGQYRPQTYH